eukprot:5891950-Alexandrium_andersonii.AAC.1
MTDLSLKFSTFLSFGSGSSPRGDPAAAVDFCPFAFAFALAAALPPAAAAGALPSSAPSAAVL